MKRIVLVLILGFAILCQSCTPSRFYLINSEGILTYNRHTGQLEFMWQSKSAGGDTMSVVKCDSLLSRK